MGDRPLVIAVVTAAAILSGIVNVLSAFGLVLTGAAAVRGRTD